MTELESEHKDAKTTFGGMLNGAAVAFAIILASIPIPIVHFVALPISPFIAGFVGGGVAKADEGQVTVFGLLVAGLALIPAVILLILAVATDINFGMPSALVIGAAIVLVPYTWFGVTIGALVSYLFRKKEAETAG